MVLKENWTLLVLDGSGRLPGLGQVSEKGGPKWHRIGGLQPRERRPSQ